MEKRARMGGGRGGDRYPLISFDSFEVHVKTSPHIKTYMPLLHNLKNMLPVSEDLCRCQSSYNLIFEVFLTKLQSQHFYRVSLGE